MSDLYARLSIGTYASANDENGDLIVKPCECDPNWPHVTLDMLAHCHAITQGSGGLLEVDRVTLSLN